MCYRFLLTFGVQADALFAPQAVQCGKGEDRFPEDSLVALKGGDNKQKKRQQDTSAHFL